MQNKTKLYISGAITGVHNARELFAAHAFDLFINDYEVVNPFEVNPELHGCDGTCVDRTTMADRHGNSHPHSYECLLRWDFVAMLGCDGVAMLPGWQDSLGATRERQVAEWAGMDIRELADWILAA